MACNTLLGNGSPTMISPPDKKKYFTLELADIACFDRQVSIDYLKGLLYDIFLLMTFSVLVYKKVI